MKAMTIERDGVVVAQEVDYVATRPAGCRRFTAFTVDDEGHGSEEIDVDARDAGVARELVDVILAEQYAPGLEVVAVEERFGLYW